MITDSDRMEAVLDDPYVLIANSKIGAVKDVLPVLEQVIQAGKPLLIVAEDLEGEAAGDDRRQQAARHLLRRRCEGAGLR